MANVMPRVQTSAVSQKSALSISVICRGSNWEAMAAFAGGSLDVDG